jgi:hypothetical protein
MLLDADEHRALKSLYINATSGRLYIVRMYSWGTGVEEWIYVEVRWDRVLVDKCYARCAM